MSTTTKDPAKQAELIEREIAGYTVTIAELEKSMMELEREASAIIEQWYYTPPNPNQTAEERMEEEAKRVKRIKSMNDEEKVLQQKYKDMLDRKDEALQALRRNYIEWINQQASSIPVSPRGRDKGKGGHGSKGNSHSKSSSSSTKTHSKGSSSSSGKDTPSTNDTPTKSRSSSIKETATKSSSSSKGINTSLKANSPSKSSSSRLNTPPKSGREKDQKEKEKERLDLSLQRSSIVSGTSRGTVEFIDYRKYFDSWDIGLTDQCLHQINLDWTKREGVSCGRTCFIFNNLKEVYVKEFDREIDINVLKEISNSYFAMSKQISHQSLLTPIGRWGSFYTLPCRILLELAQVPALVGSNGRSDPSLSGLMKGKSIKFSLKKKVEIAKAVCEAMAWLHSQGVSHARLKPSNVLFTLDWKVKVTDYGLGFPMYFIDKDKNKKHWFNSKQIHYSAPEVLADCFKELNMGQISHSAASDVWSYGMFLVALFEEKEPFDDLKSFDEISDVLSEYNHKLLLLDRLNQSYLQLKCTSSRTLLELIEGCLKKAYERKSFAKILEDKKIFDNIYRELFLVDSIKMDIIDFAVRNGVERYKQSPIPPLFPAENSEFAWGDIRTTFFPSTPIPLNKKLPLIERCTLLVLGVSPSFLTAHLAKDKDPYEIRLSKETTSKILSNIENFNPLTFGEYCQTLVHKPWFYCLFTRDEGMNRINNAVFNEKRTSNLFLVRISATNGYQFILMYVHREKFINTALTLNDYADGLVSYVERKMGELQFKALGSGQPQTALLKEKRGLPFRRGGN